MPYIEGILPKGPYPPCLRMADRVLLVRYPRYMINWKNGIYNCCWWSGAHFTKSFFSSKSKSCKTKCKLLWCEYCYNNFASRQLSRCKTETLIGLSKLKSQLKDSNSVFVGWITGANMVEPTCCVRLKAIYMHGIRNDIGFKSVIRWTLFSHMREISSGEGRCYIRNVLFWSYDLRHYIEMYPGPLH